MRSAWPLVQVAPFLGATGMVRLGEPVLDAVLVAHAVKRVTHGVPLGRNVFGEHDAVVSQHAADLVGVARMAPRA